MNIIPAVPATITTINWSVASRSACSCKLISELRALEILLSSLATSRSDLEFWFNFCTFLVVAGVVIEVVTVAAEFVLERREYSVAIRFWKRGGVPVPEKPSTRFVIIEIFAAVLVAGGVAGEFVFEEKIGIVDTCIQKADNARAVLLERQSNDAKELADKAERERIALVNRMLDIFGPRQLTPMQSARIVEKLTGLEGTKIDVFVPALPIPYDPNALRDSLDTGSAVVRTLRAAHIDAGGWVVDSCQSRGGSNLVFMVEYDDPPSQKSADRKIASKVRDAFKPEIGTWPIVEDSYLRSAACTTFSGLNGIGPNKRTHDAAISIIIGKKIDSQITPEMLESSEERKKP